MDTLLSGSETSTQGLEDCLVVLFFLVCIDLSIFVLSDVSPAIILLSRA